MTNEHLSVIPDIVMGAMTLAIGYITVEHLDDLNVAQALATLAVSGFTLIYVVAGIRIRLKTLNDLKKKSKPKKS